MMPPDSGNFTRTDPSSSTQRSDDDTAAPRAIPALAVVLEADHPRAGCLAASLDGVQRIVLGRGAERRARRQGAELTLDLDDRCTSRPHATIERQGEEFVLRDLGSSNGTFAGGERVTEYALGFDEVFRVGHVFLALLRDGGPILDRARTGRPWPFATLQADFARELTRLERVAASTLPLLLQGETGTGKEVLARAVHERSGRPGKFVAVNCGALPSNLVEAHLFGHVRGAFSGAVRDEVGFVRAAQHGTLLLDEIGDLAAPAQASLLRVLQEGEVTPVGGFQPVKVDVRVLSATHRALPASVADGSFRADLFARLSGFTFHAPPLRDRPLDVGALLASLAPSALRSLRSEAALALLSHSYPMNVRELKQALDAATVLADDGVVRLGDLPASFASPGAPPVLPSSRPPPAGEKLSEADEALRAELVARLAASDYNLTEVGRQMGRARQQVQRWVKRFGLKER